MSMRTPAVGAEPHFWVCCLLIGVGDAPSTWTPLAVLELTEA